MKELNKRYFITCDRSADRVVYGIRYVHMIVREDEDMLFCVTMENHHNAPGSGNSKLEWVDPIDAFETVKEAQMEIIRRERFNG